MDLARTIPGPLPVLATGHHAISRRRRPRRALGRIRAAPAEFCSRPDAKRSRPRVRVQDIKIRHVQQSAVAIDAAPSESRHIPSRTGHHAAAPAWRAAYADRPDAFLSRALRRRESVGLSRLVETVRTIAWMKESARQARAEGRVIGLVPTMGALHAGHVALVERAKRDCSNVIASIFVNSKQFGPKEDFAKYPRALEADSEKFSAAGVDALFLPDAAEIYPGGFRTYVSVEGLSERLEGRSRPGHFRGVATVVLKLLEIVQPHFAYFGRKDAQQVRIISQMARDLNLDTEIVVCPIVREADGLALSSRNAYLGGEERRAATVLHRALEAASAELAAGTRDSLQLQAVMRRVLEAEAVSAVDYAEVVDADAFEPVTRGDRPCYALLAVFIGKTRLIDNLYIEPVGDSGELAYHL